MPDVTDAMVEAACEAMTAEAYREYPQEVRDPRPWSEWPEDYKARGRVLVRAGLVAALVAPTREG